MSHFTLNVKIFSHTSIHWSGAQRSSQHKQLAFPMFVSTRWTQNIHNRSLLQESPGTAAIMFLELQCLHSDRPDTIWDAMTLLYCLCKRVLKKSPKISSKSSTHFSNPSGGKQPALRRRSLKADVIPDWATPKPRGNARLETGLVLNMKLWSGTAAEERAKSSSPGHHWETNTRHRLHPLHNSLHPSGGPCSPGKLPCTPSWST